MFFGYKNKKIIFGLIKKEFFISIKKRYSYFLSLNKQEVKKFLSIMLIFIFIFSSIKDNKKSEIKKYVALGDSLTAGYQDGGLVEYFQTHSFPNIIAKQLKIEDFEQPLISSPGIPPVLELKDFMPLTFSRKFGLGIPKNLSLPRPYDNLGIPGARLFQALNYDNLESPDFNPFYNIILRKLGNITEQVLLLNPDLITFWFGNNEIIEGIITGKVIIGKTIFPVEAFAQVLDQALRKLANSGAKIVIANIPDLTILPFVTILPVYIVDPNTGKFRHNIDGNKMTFIGPEGPINERWKITMVASGLINHGYGIPIAFGGNGQPLPDEVTLSPAEISSLKKIIEEYNAVIRKEAEKFGLILLDMHRLFYKFLAKGYETENIKIRLHSLENGFFSLDGIHPSSLGYAIIANEFIKKINDAFSSDIPLFSIQKSIIKKNSIGTHANLK